MLAKKKKENLDVDLDIFNHFLVPKISIISETERKNLLKKYNISENHLPKIMNYDPTVKKLDAKVGDILKIERIDPTGKYNYYRIVIE